MTDLYVDGGLERLKPCHRACRKTCRSVKLAMQFQFATISSALTFVAFLISAFISSRYRTLSNFFLFFRMTNLISVTSGLSRRFACATSVDFATSAVM
ncbi:unnamed protein product [Chondrus crispus]|uniref:Uncharacterized protein n=1 Tax=Chondrus crispus TaxID=2769 RepID=R7QID7_CHOCR|nr:unnamed protein product [Chondrus crispus]CDF37839.1 unnamed protein product [Chondrus crispus]|eukprot:XP_005717710.1 unnamed protein product [Chondrus crispus]